MRPDFENESFKNIQYLIGNEETLKGISDVPVLPVFSEEVIGFLSDLSSALLRDTSLRGYKDIAGFAYWLRRASLLREREKIANVENKLGRGVAFCIAPSNIPIQFAAIMVYSLLAGDACVVRVSNRNFDQVDIICWKMRTLLEDKHKAIASRVCMIRYEHSEEITAWLSSFCDVRAVWGGDATINAIRKNPIPPRCVELTFADRYSVAIIDSDALLDGDMKSVIDAFWLDTFYIDQNACSSPRIVIWTGNRKDEARGSFWEALGRRAAADYELPPIQTVNKFSAMSELAMRRGGVYLESKDNFVVRVRVEKADPSIMDYKEGGGYFFEYLCGDLSEIVPLLGEKHCQTVALFGVPVEEVKRLVFQNGLKGVDRIVPLGWALESTLTWDGFSIIDAMSRIVETENRQLGMTWSI